MSNVKDQNNRADEDRLLAEWVDAIAARIQSGESIDVEKIAEAYLEKGRSAAADFANDEDDGRARRRASRTRLTTLTRSYATAKAKQKAPRFRTSEPARVPRRPLVDTG